MREPIAKIFQKNLQKSLQKSFQSRKFTTFKKLPNVPSKKLSFQFALYGIVLATYFSLANKKILADSRSFSSLGPNKEQQRKQAIPMSSDTARLRSNEESYTIDRANGILRYDVSQLPSNDPIEDDHSELIVDTSKVGSSTEANSESSPSDWAFWGVFDGHSGWYTSNALRQSLIVQVIKELNEVYPNGGVELPDSKTVDDAIKSGFLKLDDLLTNKNIETALKLPRADAIQYFMPGLSGSCALLAFYDTKTSDLKIAVTGDSRALLGTLDEDSKKWQIKALSTDQTGKNVKEAQRIMNEHPDESKAVFRGRVLGRLEPSRAFGDGKFKWSTEVQKKLRDKFVGYSAPSFLKTPPYVTAEPVVTTTKIEPEKKNFLVLATDGLYEMLSHQEIAGIVIKWAEKKGIYKDYTSSKLDSLNFMKKSDEASYPDVEDVTTEKELLKPPFRHFKPDSKKILLTDENVATHVIRNALTLGTGDKDYGEMLLNIPAPQSRKYRDDLTVVVVFFGKDGKVEHTGEINVNKEATFTGPSPKL